MERKEQVEELTKELFENPTVQYRGIPFWSLTGSWIVLRPWALAAWISIPAQGSTQRIWARSICA